MSWIDLLIGAGIAASAYSSGAGLGFRRGRKAERKKISEGPKLVCSCEHGYGAHDRGGECHGQTKRANKWDNAGFAHRWEYVPCPCMAYDGPEPLSSVMAWQPPELGSPSPGTP